MSKIEPLKDKFGYVDDWQIRGSLDCHKSHVTKVAELKDVASAVAWLFEELERQGMFRQDVRDMIDAAFPDVVGDQDS